MMSTPCGIVLLAHGSRDPRWHAPVQAIAASVARRDPAVHVACAYLELSEPRLDDAVGQLAALGVKAIRVMPLFLGVGKHLREDLPRLFDELHRAHPDIRFTLLPSVGETPQVIELLAELALSHDNS